MENYGIPTEEQWAKMQKFIKNKKYKKEDFYVFETQGVGDRVVPNRYTRILPEVLEIMKQDAQKGVSLMLNHNWSQLGVQSIPIGKVFDARIGPGTQDGETTALYLTQYILKDDSKVDGYSKNDIINLIDTGILSDTSIGWGTEHDCYKCNICGNTYWSSKCSHLKGEKYIVNEETNEVKECIVEVHAPKNIHAGNNILMENSIVFDGAYPNAEIQSSIPNSNLKDGLELLDGKKELENGKILANSYNNNLELFFVPSEKGGKVMEENKNEVVEEVTETQATSVEENQEVTEPNNEEQNTVTEETQNNDNEVVKETAEEVTETQSTTEKASIVLFESELEEAFGKEISKETILRYAKDGKACRDEAIKSALNSGVRAMGNAFSKDSFAKTFELMAINDINEMAKAWENQVSEKFSSKRVSVDSAEVKKMSVEDIDYSNFKSITY